MNSLIIPAYRANRCPVYLREILAALPDNIWIGSVLDFDGTDVHAPSGLSLDDFSDLALSGEELYRMTWPELQTFSRSIGETTD